MALDYFVGDAEVYRELGMSVEVNRPGGRPRYERHNPDSPAYLDEPIAASHDRWWWLLRALLGGTHGMRLNYGSTLPQMRGERVEQYVWRLRRSFLDPFFANAVGKMVSKAFSRPVSWKGEVPGEVKAFADNVDGKSSTITAFGQALFCDALAFGLTHILVDASDKPVESLGDERTLALRWKHIRACDVLGYESAMVGAREVLVSIRFHRTLKESIGRFGTAVVNEIVHRRQAVGRRG